MGNVKKILVNAFLFLCLSLFAAMPAQAGSSESMGGGYAASGQTANTGYSSFVYDAKRGLPTSDANYVLGASDGYIWIGSYSGIIRYDGNDFTRLPADDGLTSGRGLFEDSRGRIWVGTNDNGVVVLDGNKKTHLTYEDGLPSSSIRVFAEDEEGNVFMGTTEGVCYADRALHVQVLDDQRLNGERVLRLDADSQGKIYGQTKNGLVFSIANKAITEVYTSDDLGVETITTLKTDPKKRGNVYLGTDSDVVYYGKFGEGVSKLQRISIAPLSGVHWISYDCDRIWVASISGLGFLDRHERFHVIRDIPIDSGIEMMTSDYQGNLWLASSTMGVMKLVANRFENISQKAGLPEQVTNVLCHYRKALYIGKDRGLAILGQNGKPTENALTKFVGDSRIRCMRKGAEQDLWVGTYTNDLGLVHLLADGRITSISDKDGLPDNEVRCICVQKNGTVLVGTNSGIAFIRNGKVVRTIGAAEGLKTTIILSLEEDSDGRIYAGTDGDGIYMISDDGIENIGREQGLTSDVIMRMKWDGKRSILWVVTSNSIEYRRDGVIRNVTSFPYNNNYDMFFDHNDNVWIISSYGTYVMKAGDLVKDEITDYRLYTVDNGLTGTPTPQGYAELDDDGNLYMPVREGICRVNIDRFTDKSTAVKACIGSVYNNAEEILPTGGEYMIPSKAGRITIKVAVLDYTLQNPWVEVFMEGKEDEGLTFRRSDMKPLEYTGLAGGEYTLCVRVFDAAGKRVMFNERYRIIKESTLLERPVIRLLLIAAIVLVSGFIVWRVMSSTVIRGQYEEIKQAKEEAERANTVKTRFLANISHEIRTPINTIMGMNEMILREDATGVPKPYFLSMMNYAFDIRNASEALLSLINDLLDMSKIESGKMNVVQQEYDTEEMLRSVVSMIRIRSTEKELTFDVVIDEILPRRLYGDEGKVKQIVLNLLTNAVKYTERGGFILSVSMVERVDDRCTVRFSVKDTGIGVRKEDMDKLFAAYERLDEQKNSGIQGTGLGLDISRRFAELMGGSLVCESEYGKGSEFILTLSQKIVDPKAIGVFRERDESVGDGPYVPQFVAPDADVLVVDDNPMNLNVIKGLLKATQVYVSTASSGEECLDKLKDTRFDVVLLDHMMPGMDGVETLAHIRKDYPDIPVYALTANTAVGEEFYVEKGFDGYLSKPIDTKTLEQTIMKHLPEEMMEQPTAAAVEEELKEIPENLTWIYETEGVSVPAGIKNSGGISNFLYSLELFSDTIDDNAGVIRNAYDSGDLRMYTIKVHALKSSAKFIGALELSRLAEMLEDAGNREDIAVIDDNTPKLLADYEAFRDKLAGIHGGTDEEKEPMPQEELADAYLALSDVIPMMDYDSAEFILTQMQEYALPREDENKVRELVKKLRMLDWDGMEVLLANGGNSGGDDDPEPGDETGGDGAAEPGDETGGDDAAEPGDETGTDSAAEG